MLLQEYKSDKIAAYIKAERYVNNGSPSGFSKKSTSQNTEPKSGTKEFSIYEIAFGSNIKSVDYGNCNKYYSLSHNSMLIHPDSLCSNHLNGEQATIINHLLVVPTSSGRTVLYKGTSPFFIKLAYPDYLGRVSRDMHKYNVLSAIEVSTRLETAADKIIITAPFAFFKEDAGRVVTLESGYEWGVIFREFSPYPYAEDEEYLIPFFSLFSKETDPGTNRERIFQDPYLLQQLYMQQKSSIEDFLLNQIIYPLCSTYFEVLLNTGVELEAHAQNMLLGVDKDFHVTRIICRDLESAGRDITLMQRLGISYSTDNPYKQIKLNEEIYDKYPLWYIDHSFMFDFKLGEYMLTPLLECAKICFPEIDLIKLQEKIKEYNQQFIQRLPDYFPNEWCCYENINFRKEGKKRTYIWNEYPKYR